MTESEKQRLESLERVVRLQHEMLNKLETAVTGHQVTIEAFAKLLGVELQPAQPPTASD